MPAIDVPPVLWRAPVEPVRVERAYRLAPAFASGGHRGIDLASRPGQTVRAPCAGRVSFRGSVAGGPPTVTIRCGSLRATLQRTASGLSRGAPVRAQQVVGVATGGAVDLSARRSDGTYLDPLTLLAPSARSVPPVALGRSARPARPAVPGPPSHRLVTLVDRALVTPNPAARAASARFDVPLAVGGAALAALAAVVGAVRAGVWARRRRASLAGRRPRLVGVRR